MSSHDQFQGGLDGLCGLYSIYNSLRVLFPRLAVDILDTACKTAVRTLHADDFQNMFLDGMNDDQLLYILGVIQEELANLGKHFNFISLQASRSDGLMTSISNATNKDGAKVAFIVGINGRINHYTCVTGIAGDSLELKDSGGLRRIHQDKFKVSASEEDCKYYKICPTYFMLSRID